MKATLIYNDFLKEIIINKNDKIGIIQDNLLTLCSLLIYNIEYVNLEIDNDKNYILGSDNAPFNLTLAAVFLLCLNSDQIESESDLKESYEELNLKFIIYDRKRDELGNVIKENIIINNYNKWYQLHQNELYINNINMNLNSTINYNDNIPSLGDNYYNLFNSNLIRLNRLSRLARLQYLTSSLINLPDQESTLNESEEREPSEELEQSGEREQSEELEQFGEREQSGERSLEENEDLGPDIVIEESRLNPADSFEPEVNYLNELTLGQWSSRINQLYLPSNVSPSNVSPSNLEPINSGSSNVELSNTGSNRATYRQSLLGSTEFIRSFITSGITRSYQLPNLDIPRQTTSSSLEIPLVLDSDDVSLNLENSGVFHMLQTEQNPQVMLYPASSLPGQALLESAEIDTNPLEEQDTDSLPESLPDLIPESEREPSEEPPDFNNILENIFNNFNNSNNINSINNIYADDIIINSNPYILFPNINNNNNTISTIFQNILENNIDPEEYNMPPLIYSDDINNRNHVYQDIIIGLTEDQFNELECSEFNLDQEENCKQIECLICMDEFIEKEEIIKLKCEHNFHKCCIKKWLCGESNKCPICRMEVSKGTPLNM